MPSHNSENDSHESSNKPTSHTKLPSAQQKTQNSGEEHVRSNQPHDNKSRDQKPQVVDINKIPKIDVIEGIEANRIARNANRISGISGAINLVLMVCTIILAIVAIQQANSARDAAQIAKNTLDETKAFNKQTLKRQDSSNLVQATSDSQKYSRDTATFNLQKKGLQAQITAFKEAQKEFDIENKPFIQIMGFTIDTLSPTYRVGISFYFKNSGKQPVRCFHNKYGVDFEKGDKFIMKPNINWTYENLNSYLAGTTVSHSYWKSKDTMTTKDLNMILHGKAFGYVFGELQFENPANGKKGVYKYQYRLKPTRYGLGTDGIIDTMIYDKPIRK